MRKNKVLVIGANGALGHDLMQVLDHPVPAYHRDFDVRDGDAARAFIQSAGVNAVVNTAAFHQVPSCESEFEAALGVNTVAVKTIAEICHDLGVRLCHISTDYVFDGKKGDPYGEDDLPSPLSAYAISKLAGEYAVSAYCHDHLIVRSCGLYGRVPTRAKGGNFITSMIRLGTERDKVSVVDDERVCPTSTLDLAHGLRDLLQTKSRGLFHITQSGCTTWFQFARIIFDRMNLRATLVPTSAESFQSVVKRPIYSCLDNAKFNGVTGKPLRPWDEALIDHLSWLKHQR